MKIMNYYMNYYMKIMIGNTAYYVHLYAANI